MSPARVGVMSDTHDNLAKIDSAVQTLLGEGVEVILHLGDYVAPFSLARILRPGRRFIGVMGNNDGERLGLREVAAKAGQEIYEPPHVLEISRRRILMLHGHGPRERTRSLVESLARSGDYDAVLYGHTHEVDVRIERGVLILNPGEVFGGLTGRSTVAVLDLERMEARILEI